MLEKEIYVVDIEGNGLLNTITKIHCLVAYNVNTKEYIEITDYKDIIEFLNKEGLVIVGHNFIRYDKPAIEKIIGVKVECEIIDTLAISWILEEKRKHHSLESWGETFGIQKVVIDDWKDGSVESYLLRCKTDVKINTALWSRQYSYLKKLYEDDVRNLERYFKYLTFKMECVYEQETTGLKLDIGKAQKYFDKLSELKEEKLVELEAVMPKVAVKKKKVYRDAIRGEDGTIYQKGDLFFPGGECSDITEEKIIGWKEPNANSHVQIKEWLYSLGWVPQNILHKRDKKTNEVKKIPQVKSQFEVGEVCESVKLLFEKEPKLEVLNGLSILTHRIGIFNGFLNDQIDGRLYPSMNGFTNTLRFKHRVIVNLPRAYREYGKEIRECLIADDGCVLMGADLSGIEDSTKRHYIYQYDPEYVERMNVEGYDPHLELAVMAKFMTNEDVIWYKEFEIRRKSDGGFKPTEEEQKRFDGLVELRYKAKQTNFSATYKVGAKALSIYPGINLGIKEAKRVLGVYWKLNKSILDVEDSLEIKEIYGQKWLFNPMSRFWYTLRSDKDKFSTLNQGSAVYCFDLWVTNIRNQGMKVPFSYHDEIAANVKKGEKKKAKEVVNTAIQKLNDKLKLNVELKCSVDFGNTYAHIH